LTRLAWFTPAPASRSGIAAYSAEILPRGWQIDVYSGSNAADFVWSQRRSPYALVVYQLGNAACHDFMWGYVFRYPGLLVLHDAQLHQARALALTRRWQPRREDYLAEFRANHPDASPAVGEVIAAGFGQPALYALWPHIRLLIASARLTIVHNRRLLADLRRQFPSSPIEAVDMGVADPRGTLDEAAATERARAVRARHGIPDQAVVLAAFGGITPEKRIPSLLRALATTATRHANLHLMLVGAEAAHYDVRQDATRWGLDDRVHVTGYVADTDLPDHLLAADICASLRWPTNRETSASWLRALAAGRATLVSDLADLCDVPTVDPRGWQPRDTASPARPPVAVGIDVLDEDHSLQLALDALAAEPSRRTRLGTAAHRWWVSHHQLTAMADAYDRVLTRAADAPTPRAALPLHLTDDWSENGRRLAAAMNVADRVADVLGTRRDSVT
jgi:glycosyltransferase involved in cell wall biosynthesis